MNTCGRLDYTVAIDNQDGSFAFRQVGIAGDGSLLHVGLTHAERAQASEKLAATLEGAAAALRRTANRR